MKTWTPEMALVAKAGFAAGLSYSKIAEQLGDKVSRSAVGGFLAREGLKRNPELCQQSRSQRIKRSPKPEKIASPKKPRVSPLKPTREAGDVYAPMAEIRKAAWIALEGSTPQAEIPNVGFCKWPIGTWDENDRFYCCNPAKRRQDGNAMPYCTDHAAMAYNPPKDSFKRLERSALWAAKVAA